MNQSKDNVGTEHLRRTKVIATLGPATDEPGVLESIIVAGVNVVRLNFSHDTHDKHVARIEQIRSIMQTHDCVVGILADLQGPKIRIARFAEGAVDLKPGQRFVLDASLDENAGTVETVGIHYKALPQDVSGGDLLLLNDGLIQMRVDEVDDVRVVCTVEVGGVLSDHKGINRQGGGLSAEALTDKDREDLECALACDVDYVALSFPRHADDVIRVKRLIAKAHKKAGVIAKIERAEAVEAVDEIIEASDGIMVARGDLALEIGDSEVPVVQKHMIYRARALNKPVIIATQMMESMITSSVPTRAEVSDVANAVLDNVDAVMLSAETAAGDHPLRVIESVVRVCVVVEKEPRYQLSRHRVECQFQRIDEAVAMATMYTANHLDIRAIVTLTESGATPLWMSRIRTAIPIFGFSRYERALGRMTLYRGVYPVSFDVTLCTRDEANKKAVDVLEMHHDLEKGDMIVLTKGDHLGVGGGSNAMKILVVGEVV